MEHLDRHTSLKQLAEAAQVTFWGYLGCEFVSLSETRAVIRLDVREHHLNSLGIMHGGVHASLLDNAMGLVAMTAYPDRKAVTMNLNIHYLAPVGVEAVTVQAEIVHATDKTITTRGSVYAGTRLMAIGSGSFRIIGVPPPPG